MTTTARVESILPPITGRYAQRVAVSYRRLNEGEADTIVGTAEMSPQSFRGVFGGEPEIGHEYRVVTEPVESGA